MKKIAYSMDRIMLQYKNEIEDVLKEFSKEVIFTEGSEIVKVKANLYQRALIEFTKNGRRKNPFLFLYKKEQEKRYKKLLKKLEGCEVLLDVGGPFFSFEFIKRLRAQNKGIKIIKFIWDKTDEETVKDLKSKYDEIFTFEKEDAKKYNLHFRTSFFIAENIEEKELDCYYLGGLREIKRYEFIEAFDRFFKKKGLKADLKLYIKKRKMKKEYRDHSLLIHEPLSYMENLEKTRKARTLIELNYLT